MNRLDRLVAIILFLQSKRIVRAKEIAEHFAISIRTVYRDVKALCEAGVPIAAEAGEGYSMLEGYHLPPVMFTPEEASALSLGGQFIEKLTDKSMVKQIESALLKIQSVLPVETQEYLEKLQDSTTLFVRRTAPQSEFKDDVLLTIQDAIVNRNVLKMEYYSQYRDSYANRNINPLGLVYYGNHWHLIAYCQMRSDYRDFRTDRIKKIVPTDEHFKPDENFSLEKYTKDYFKPANLSEIKIKINKSIAGSIKDRNHYGLIKEEEVKNGVVMTYLVPQAEWILNWLLSFGTAVEIISPVSLRESLCQQAQKLVNHYK